MDHPLLRRLKFCFYLDVGHLLIDGPSSINTVCPSFHPLALNLFNQVNRPLINGSSSTKTVASFRSPTTNHLE
ncbi:hypothetical protein HAX54_053366, partial [Datura stramonium]|nr:hypothetical protein [Datura stramonium]